MTHKTLTTDAQISAYLHRTRMTMLKNLQERPQTISQIASQMKVHPANLTRHIRVLEQAGLIELVEKRDTGRNLEKYYAAIANSFDVAPEAEVNSIHKAALTMVRSDLSAALAQLDDGAEVAISALLSYARISSKDIKKFAGELAKLTAKFQATDNEHGMPYHLNLSLYPSDQEVAPEETIRLKKKL